jgi:hypothetical protein
MRLVGGVQVAAEAQASQGSCHVATLEEVMNGLRVAWFGEVVADGELVLGLTRCFQQDSSR